MITISNSSSRLILSSFFGRHVKEHKQTGCVSYLIERTDKTSGLSANYNGCIVYFQTPNRFVCKGCLNEPRSAEIIPFSKNFRVTAARLTASVMGYLPYELRTLR